MLFIYCSLMFGAFVLSSALFFPSLTLSYAVGAIDIPNSRKTHSIPTARGGGFAFFAAFSLLLPLLPIDTTMKMSLIAGGAVIFLTGFLDDAISLSPFAKLTGQFGAASVYLFLSGYNKSVFGGILTLLWLVFLANAINLSDGLNGLAGGISVTEALCIAVLALVFGSVDVFLCSLLLFFAVLGFLPRNFPRARIFMGDCGALFLGFILGALSSKLVLESESIICLISILLVFRVPTYDTNLSIIRRLFKHKNPFAADRGHFHHRLVRWGFTKECATLALVTVSLIFGFIGVVISAL